MPRLAKNQLKIKHFWLCRHYLKNHNEKFAKICQIGYNNTNAFFWRRFNLDFFTFGDNMDVITNPLGMFSLQHLLTLLFFFIVGIILVKRYKSPELQSTLRRQMAIAILFLEVIRQVVLLVTNSHAWEFLPLHLCAFGVYLILIDAYFENKYTKEVIFMLTLPGALAALITPDWANNPLINFFTIQSFSIHALMVIYAIMRLKAGELSLHVKNIWMPTTFLFGITPLIMGINHLLDTNFFFLTTGPEGTPLAALQSQFGGFYISSLALLFFIVWLIMYFLLGIRQKFIATEPELREV